MCNGFLLVASIFPLHVTGPQHWLLQDTINYRYWTRFIDTPAQFLIIIF